MSVGVNAAQAGETVANKIKAKLGTSYTFRRNEVVGPQVSHELFNDGVLATVLAIIFISIYVAFRFEWQYGIGALIATGHDVFVTAGMFSVLHMDFTLNSVAALLLLAGYSINDTVVVFDRIRENIKLLRREKLSDIVDRSINQTLSRTIITSGTVFLATLSLLIFGGGEINDFAFTFLVGIIVGTYSSIYIASALVLWWHKGQRPTIGAPPASIENAAPARV